MKAAGFEGSRFSIAWSRIYPEGEGDAPNAEGVQHYHDVIDALLERGLEPMVTLYHWDLPQVCLRLVLCGCGGDIRGISLRDRSSITGFASACVVFCSLLTLVMLLPAESRRRRCLRHGAV